jgi:dTDP-4-amino-4,6-dideoxygalactose transaminase
LTQQKPAARDTDMKLLAEGNDVIPLFWPHITQKMRDNAGAQLQTRWLGQGPRVDEFEGRFNSEVLEDKGYSVAVNSGTSALHLAYKLAIEKYFPDAGKKLGGHVICPVFTCTATNLPWLYMGMDIVWADIDPVSMNISADSVEALINSETRAISVVHYGGYPADMERLSAIAAKWGIPIIEDAAQALGGVFQGSPIGTISDYTAFSFQAIKHITTGDGGLLALTDQNDLAKAKRVRWFGIDRAGKQNGTWENDITEIGYKYQMTDIAASLGLGGLDDLQNVMEHRTSLLARYESNLEGNSSARLLVLPEEQKNNSTHAAWLATVVVEEGRNELREALRAANIESNPVHFRNDIYTVFEEAVGECPVMDSIDGKYLCLPLHTNMSLSDVDRVSEVITGAW